MKKSKSRIKLMAAGVFALALGSVVALSACGGGSNTDAYDTYASAYNKVSANGGIDANLDVELTMDGKTNKYTGNFVVDNVNNMIYYTMTSDGKTTTQFSDGKYLYTDRGDQKVKFDLSKDAPAAAPQQDKENKGQAAPQGQPGPDGQAAPGGQPAPSADAKAPEFDTANFLNEFSSFLDAGKVKELGLLEPIAKAAVSKTTAEGDVYTLEVADSIAEKFVNTLATQQAGNADAVQVEDLKNFTYTATVKDGVVTGCQYSGDATVKVPGSLMTDGKDAEYTLNMKINIDFVNPGEVVKIDVPDTKDYVEL